MVERLRGRAQLLGHPPSRAGSDSATVFRRIQISPAAADGLSRSACGMTGSTFRKAIRTRFSRILYDQTERDGMGLTIVRSIVEAHRGELGAENVGRGAQVFFR